MTDTKTLAAKPTATQVEQEASWLGARLREPSTYAGLAVLLGLFGFHDVPNAVKYISEIGMGVGGLIAIFLPELKKAANGAVGKTVAMFAIGFIGSFVFMSIALAHPARAQSKVPLPAARPAPASTKPTIAQAQQNPLLLLQQFSVSDLQAALADANAQTPPDAAAANCYTALIQVINNGAANPLPAGPGLFQALQKARDAKAMLANLQSPTGPLSSLNTACAPLVLDAQTTLVTLGLGVGLVANPVGAPAALAGLPAAIAAFLALPKL